MLASRSSLALAHAATLAIAACRGMGGCPHGSGAEVVHVQRVVTFEHVFAAHAANRDRAGLSDATFVTVNPPASSWVVAAPAVEIDAVVAAAKQLDPPSSGLPAAPR